MQKGSNVFWGKAMRKITSDSCFEHVLPITVNWIGAQHDLTGRITLFMQDNAPSHKSIGSMEFLYTHLIVLMFWQIFFA